MPVNIYDLSADRKTITLELGAADLTVTYRPNSLTPARELAILRQARSDSEGDDGFEEIEQAERSIQRQIQSFIEVIEAWDFMGPLALAADGATRLDIPRDQMGVLDAQAFAEAHGGKVLVPAEQVVPIRFEFLKLIPSNFLMTIVRKVNEDMGPKKKRG